MTKKLLLALLLITTSVSASYNMAFAKATQNVKFDAKTVSIKYYMDEKLKGYLEKELPVVLQRHGIAEGEGEEIAIIPVLFTEYDKWFHGGNKLPYGKTKKQIDDYLQQTKNTNLSEQDAKNLVANFVHGFSRIGQGSSSTFADGMKSAGANGLYMLGVGLAFNGANALGTMSDQYILISDVYFGEQRTRVFAFVYSASINEKEAYESLTKLTAKKIAELASGKGEKRCDLE